MRWLIPVAILVVAAGFVYQNWDTISSIEGTSFAEGISVMQAQVGEVDSSLNSVKDSYAALAAHGSTNVDGARPGVVEPDPLTDLISDWNYSYEQAQLSYDRFANSLAFVEGRAESYFEAQRLHTAKYNDPALKAREEANDLREKEQYNVWLRKTHVFQRELLEHMKELEDMDTSLQKIKLRKDLSTISVDFGAIPVEISSLQSQLEAISSEATEINDEINLFFQE